MKTKKDMQTLACLMIVLQGALYGLGDPLAKVAYGHMGVYSLLTLRYSIGVVFMFLLFGRRILRNLRGSRVRDWIMPCICVAGAYLTNNLALTYTDVTIAVFFRSASVVATPLILFVTRGKRITLPQVLVIAGAVVGLYLLCCNNGMQSFGLGEIMGVATALFSAGAMITSQSAMQHIDSITLTTMQTGASMVFSFLGALLFEGGVTVGAMPVEVWGIIVYLAIVCTIGGYMLQNIALKSISPRTMSMVKCICPVMTAGFSFLILGERLLRNGIIGSGIILVCVLIQTWMKDQD